jgi:hypothetical protein
MSEWAAIARRNRDTLRRSDLRIGGVQLEELRRQARADFLEQCRRFGCGPDASDTAAVDKLWFMTGHQPELYHPGVWAKNFAVASVAQACGGVGLNLVADTDQIKSDAVRVVAGTIDAPKAVTVSFDSVDDGRPFEAWRIRDEAVFRRFGEAIHAESAALPDDPLIDSFWPGVLAVDSPSGTKRISLTRHKIESSWGFGLAEAPMSHWAETPAVIRLFSAILADLPRFHQIHDERLTAYRREHKIHSRNHPVADLTQEGEWFEAPLWVWRDATPLRKKLWIKTMPGSQAIALRIDGEPQAIGTLPIDIGRIDESAIAQFAEWAGAGIRIRPRALVTTALCRILLADLFVHGIGGAIYDVLGDSVFAQFFDMPMPEYAVMSATLRLADFPESRLAQDRDTQIRLRRYLCWQAERLDMAATDAEVEALLAEKEQWLAWPTEERRERRRRAVELRRINREIAHRLSDPIHEAEERIETLSRRTANESLVRSREFSIVIHSIARLRRLAEKIREGANS